MLLQNNDFKSQPLPDISDAPPLEAKLSSYSPIMKMVEVVSLISFFLLFGSLLGDFAFREETEAYLILISIVLALIFSDFVSGFVHWFADTWGSLDWPIVGPSLIRSFREHHVLPKAITEHNFAETNGASALVTLPILITVYWCQSFFDSKWEVFFMMTLLNFCLFILFTNQIHKWAHMDKSPILARLLQSIGLVMSAQHHRTHHRGIFDQHYCITTGWLNGFLNKIQFFRRMETLITRFTGWEPRAEDFNIHKKMRES